MPPPKGNKMNQEELLCISINREGNDPADLIYAVEGRERGIGEEQEEIECIPDTFLTRQKWHYNQMETWQETREAI